MTWRCRITLGATRFAASLPSSIFRATLCLVPDPLKMRAQLDDVAVATATTASSTGLEAKEVVVEEEEEQEEEE